MQGLVNYQAIFERAFASTLQKVKGGQKSGVDWDTVANMYNEMTSMEADSTLNLLSLLPLSKEDSVLDVGCGPARLSVPLAKKVKSVSALDPFAKMLEYARQNAKQAGVDNINFIQKSWSDEEAVKDLPKHDIVIASRSLGLFDIKKLCKFAKKYVVMTSFLVDHPSLKTFWQDFLEDIKENEEEHGLNDRNFSYNLIFNIVYDMGANPNLRIVDTVYEKDFASLEEAFSYFRFVGEIAPQKEEIYKRNVEKYLTKTNDGYKFKRATKSYLIWWDVREIKDKFE
ncbi:class I SAM-dependent methyltransferase [uncultured Campylobacter sp.]|uniref:class I SAM-dependent methyltransferase n=1 Tax=uncultured Campylobacter sp. TaxID=218934 RepID=UPI0028E81AE1|nr:class I SAM-dependent methyltransferase [uncultured Campylobacter sp.]